MAERLRVTSRGVVPPADGRLVIDRRAFLLSTLALAVAGRVEARTPRNAPTRLILLGTAGGPRPRRTRSAPAQVIVSNGAAYVIDCGDGIARQLVLAGVPLSSLRHVFITHNHSDHNAGYGPLLLLAWAGGLRTRVDTWGPPPLDAMTGAFFEMNAYDIETRTRDEGRTAFRPLIHAHELSAAGVVVQDGDIKVTAALVDHPPVVPAFAYRFDAPDRSIVISGDTRPSDDLVALARGADVLVHEAMFPSAVERLVAGVANASDLKRSILGHHTSAEDAGRIAQRAGVGTLVLSHLIPAEDFDVTDEMWLEAAGRHFNGRVILGRDLLET